MKTKTVFEKEPLKMLDVCLEHFISNEKMDDELKSSIKENISDLSSIPEGVIMDKINPFLEANIFEHDLSDLVDCGIYAFIYSNALSLVAGSRKNGAIE
jgi:hypothetical protein